MSQSSSTQSIRPLRRGQLTIPSEFRGRLGIGDDAQMQLMLREGTIVVVPVVANPAQGSAWARELYAMFAPIRTVAAEMNEAEINSEIDAAVAAVRTCVDGRYSE